MKNIVIILCLVFLVKTTYAQQCIENQEERVLLVGDSWAFFMGVDGTFNNVFDDWGHTDKRFYTNTILAENGATADDFLSANKQSEIAAQLLSRPSIDFVHLSLGGNDVLGNWKVSFTQQQTDSLKNEVLQKLDDLINFIKGIRPDIKIVWSGYVYTNFEEVIEDFFFSSSHPFYGTWQGMEFPDNETINQVLIEFSNEFELAYQNDPRVEFMNAPGLMQFTQGQTNPLSVAPFGTYQPGEAPLPYGFEDYPSPKSSMRNYGAGIIDCFHLSVLGYYQFIAYQTELFYHKALMYDLQFEALEQYSGSIVDNTVSPNLQLGNSNNNHVTNLYFDLTNIYPYEVTKGNLYLHINDDHGNVLNLEKVNLRLKADFFGSMPEIDANDLNDTPDIADSICVFGEIMENNWVRFELPLSFLPFIENQSSVVLQLENENSDLISFTGPNSGSFSPILDLKFDESAVAVSELDEVQDFNLKVFPNPTSEVLNVQTTGNISVVDAQVFSIQGKSLNLDSSNINQFNLTGIQPGVYILRLQLSNGEVVNKRFIKQ